MTGRDITICGHGSNTPSLKNLYEYCENRYNSYCTNSGKRIRKQLMAVKRLKVLSGNEQKFHDTYKTILGRNGYNQNLRLYCYTPYPKDGKYYSDCSSSGCQTFDKLGYNCPTYTCGGIYNSDLFETVPVEIVNGHITNPEILKVGDALLFAGATAGRPLDISHVEYVYEIPAEQVKNGWYEENNGWYYYKNGKKLKKKWLNYKHHWYRLGIDGKMLVGWHLVPDKNGINAMCYFDETEENLGAEWHERSDHVGFLEIWTTET